MMVLAQAHTRLEIIQLWADKAMIMPIIGQSSLNSVRPTDEIAACSSTMHHSSAYSCHTQDGAKTTTRIRTR